MAARDIEYVEIYTGDRHTTIDYFVSAMGFAAVAESRAEDRESVLLRQGRVQLVVTTGPVTGAFLDEHGDGVADIALICQDVAGTAAAAEAAGAAVRRSPLGGPVVSGFGSVVHTLLPATPETGTALPAGRSWTPLTTARAVPGRIRLLDHIAVCVDGGSLARWADFYSAGFGLERYSSEYVDVGGQAMDSIVVRSPSGGVTYTLVAPDPAKDPGQLDAFLERNSGPGVQHLAFLVDDIVPAVHEMRERGAVFLQTPASYYDMLMDRIPEMRTKVAELRDANVLADHDEWGHLLQLFTRSPHPRNTLFYELIQRSGARGFGSSNIRALYEAVERDRLVAD